MADIATRGSWGARYDDGDLTLYGLALEVFAHHTVTTQLLPSASVEDERAEMRKIEAVGESRFGTGISYNVIVFPSGRAYQGVSWNRRGTHTGGRNSTARSICFAGNYETNEPTEAQLVTASEIYHGGKGRLWQSAAPLRGHRDVSQTACPGRHVYAKLPAIRAGIAPTPEPEGFPMALSDDAQTKLAKDAHEARLFSEQNKAKLTRLEGDLDARRELDLAHMSASSARERALLAALDALATSVGLDPGEVLARIEAKLDALGVEPPA